LGPLLFSIYVNDLPNVISSCDINMYADDSETANSGTNNLDFKKLKPISLLNSEVTVVEVMLSSGYATAMFGKWHLGVIWPVPHPGIHGFDQWWTTERSAPTCTLNCACYLYRRTPSTMYKLLHHYVRYYY